MITESINVRGNLEIKLFDSENNLKDKRDIKNLVVATGKDYIVQRMTSNATLVMDHMAVGVGNVAPGTSNVLLLGEIGRVALDSTTVTDNTVTYIATFPAGTGTGTIAEAGIFNSGNTDANTGTMLCRTQFNEVNKAADDVIVITWNVTVE